MTAHHERAALEREAHEVLRHLRCGLDDLAAVLERLRQIREASDAPRDHSLVVEHGPNGRPEVTR
ncbi:hypothetical protein LuPra_04546 [Luteitalea pratensis]|uniref:Uncharacterized protein n=1 Tax=Luteitalea pratensis TaxID=1855912 RepID=A0A143PT21_LUTPR|nr:hypothetical protein [Luteitalea pratensis]AMY11298.1 hypothetical protein LuPra_04546 [Luteitalea pratensis]